MNHKRNIIFNYIQLFVIAFKYTYFIIQFEVIVISIINRVKKHLFDAILHFNYIKIGIYVN